MAVEKRWINWSTAVCSALLLILCLTQAVLAFYLNLTTVVSPLFRMSISASLLASLAVLLFPTAWIGFAACISRHRGVYIALMVMHGLSFLDSVGMLAYQSYTFGVSINGFQDAESGISIAIVIVQSVIIFIQIFCMAFTIVALCSGPKADRRQVYTGYPGYGYPQPPAYRTEVAPTSDPYRMASMPRINGWDYPAQYYSKGGKY